MPAVRALPLLRRAALAALLFSTTPTSFAQQQPPRQQPPILVESVNVMGNRRLTREEIFKHVKTRPGDHYDDQQVQRDLQTLVGLGVFDRRTTRVFTELGLRGGVEVSFEVQELPVIESVKFEGLRRVDEGALIEGLRRRSLAVDGGSVYEPDKITRAVDAMKELLRGRGWRRVEVVTRVDQTAINSVKLTFVVSGLPPRSQPPKRLDGPRRRVAIA